MRWYSLTEGVGIAVDALRANKVRAGLTILGIAVGVFVVVAISAAVHGINASVAREFDGTGPTTFFLSRYPISFEARSEEHTSELQSRQYLVCRLLLEKK